jgi:hypothetical protein
MGPSSCGCGEQRSHIVARRHTADGVFVALWDDGALTGALAHALPGVRLARPRSRAGARAALAAGWLFVGEVEIHDAAELPALYDACRRVAERGGRPGDVRARLAALERPKITPIWTVLATDRNGRPTERVWRLPRLRWPGLAVWDRMHGERYELNQCIDRRRDVFAPTGIRFATLAELAAHLDTIGVAG